MLRDCLNTCRLMSPMLNMYVSREELRQKAEEEASKRQKEAQEYLKRVHAISAERRAKAAAHLRAKAAV